MKKIKYIKRQDSGYKLSSGNSGETSLNLSNEIFTFISHGSLRPGEEKDIAFRLYKEDFIKAMSFVIMKLPLYKTSSNYSNKVDNYLDTFGELYSRIETFFGSNKYSEYKVNLFYRNDGRIYLRGLRVNGFSIRDYLVENFSAIQFDDEGGILNLRIFSDIEDNGGEETKTTLIVNEKNLTRFILSTIKYFNEKDGLDAIVPFASNSSPIKVYKENAFKLTGMFLESTIDDVKSRNADHQRWFEDIFKLGGREVFLSTQWNGQGDYQLTLPDFIELIRTCYGNNYSYKKGPNGEHQLYFAGEDSGKKSEDSTLQQIFYGAPGTGKSHKIKNNANVKIADEKNLVFRTTFHPDSDYSTFVGAYKPTMKPVADKYKAVAGKDEEITYSFAPQAFLQAYVAAWNNPEDNVYLIIEEINRGNCAQIFGDLFQLLDRKEGVSEYPIMADRDLAKYLLNGKDENNVDVLTNKEGIKDGKLCLPKNLYIWATMNTSDQSLFPIDSAFKRRWDWVYIPIKNHEEINYNIDIDGAIYKWWGFLNKINYVIGQITSSEDKKLGYFFVKANDKIVDANKFVGKVLFYLWNDVFKNYGFENAIFNRGDNKIFNFSDFFDKNGEPDTAVVNEFLKRLDETVDKEHSFVLIENEGSPSSLIIMHNGESIEGDSAVSKYIEFINRAIKEKDVNEVADCLGADMTQTPPEDTTRKFLQVADSGWYLATNIGIGVMKSNINKIKKLGVDVVIE